MANIIGKDWIIEPLGLDSRTNYSCFGYNDGGHGQAATIFLDVFAPPFFIKNLNPYTGVLYSSRNASLSCRIECVPRCKISWLRDNVEIDAKDSRYFVKEEYVASSPATGDFESVLSVLHFNMSAWPNHKFDALADNANYSCVSSENTVGPGVRSSTYFGIQCKFLICKKKVKSIKLLFFFYCCCLWIYRRHHTYNTIYSIQQTHQRTLLSPLKPLLLRKALS